MALINKPDVSWNVEQWLLVSELVRKVATNYSANRSRASISFTPVEVKVGMSLVNILALFCLKELKVAKRSIFSNRENYLNTYPLVEKPFANSYLSRLEEDYKSWSYQQDEQALTLFK